MFIAKPIAGVLARGDFADTQQTIQWLKQSNFAVAVVITDDRALCHAVEKALSGSSTNVVFLDHSKPGVAGQIQDTFEYYEVEAYINTIAYVQAYPESPYVAVPKQHFMDFVLDFGGSPFGLN